MITSVTNRNVKRIVQLCRKAGQRRKEDVFIVEGSKMFEEAPKESIQEVYLSESYLRVLEKGREDPAAGALAAKLRECCCETVSDEVFSKMSDTQTPQGILCVLRQFHYRLQQLLAQKGAPLFLVLEGLQDPGNLGTMFRAGEGAGVTGIIMSRETVDIYNPKTIRATMGSVYRMPFYYAEDIAETVSELKRSAVAVYAAHLEGALAYDVCDYKEGTAFLIGNEGNGLTKQTADCADARVVIPMKGSVESLNAAVAASLLVFEAARQRR